MINNGKMRFCCSPCNLYLPQHVCPPGPEPWCNPSWVQYSENASTKWTQPASTAQSGEPEQSDIVISINQEHSVRYRDKTWRVTRSSYVTFPYLWELETIMKPVLNVSQSEAFPELIGQSDARKCPPSAQWLCDPVIIFLLIHNCGVCKVTSRHSDHRYSLLSRPQ